MNSSINNNRINSIYEEAASMIEVERIRKVRDDGTELKGLDIHLTYPYSDTYKFETKIALLNLDEERLNDLKTGNGFVISEFTNIKKEMKEYNGIFSTRYGRGIGDANPFKDKYSCSCKQLTSRIYNGIVCPHCNTRVKFVDDNYGMFGYLVLLKHQIIHPTIYKQIESLIGTQRLINILDIEEQKDENGHTIEQDKVSHRKGFYRKEKGPNEPFYGIGMDDFRERFKEIIDYYYSIATNKASKGPYYDCIVENMDKVFTYSIPVYTTHLRPYSLPDKKRLGLEGTNAIYTMMSKLTTSINDDKLRIFRKKKLKNQLLFDLQMKYSELNTEINSILSGKKGYVRQLQGGRLNFSSRCVITQDPTLTIDQISLPYFCLVELLQQQIINVLIKVDNLSPNDAHGKWYKANIDKDDRVVEIIQGIMFANPKGLPVIINRNPSIAKGSLLQVFCVKMSFDYVMRLNLQTLPLLAADFDGDVLNIFYIISDAFYKRAYQVMNPRNSMYISNNDGLLNRDVIPNRDILIITNTLTRLGRDTYTQEEIDYIKSLQKDGE